MQSAIAALDVYKEMAEDAHAEVGVVMLKYMHYREDSAVYYGYGQANEQVLVSYEDFSPKALFIECELSAKAPTDYMQRINAAVALNQQLWFPREEAYRFLSVENPKELEEQHVQEQINDFVLKMKLTEYQTMIQEKLQQRMMANRQKMMAEQGPPPGAGGAPPGARQVRPETAQPRSPQERAAFIMAQNAGQRYNPAQRGTAPANVNPSATREQITGVDRQGEPIS